MSIVFDKMREFSFIFSYLVKIWCLKLWGSDPVVSRLLKHIAVILGEWVFDFDIAITYQSKED